MGVQNVEKLSSIQLFFLTYVLQSTVIFFSLPRQIAEVFGTNGWVMIFVFSGIAMLNIYLFQLVYKKGNGASVFDIINDTLPKMIRFPIYVVLAIAWAFVAAFISKQYIFVVQIVAFPTTPSIYLLAIFMAVVFLYLQHPVYKMVRIAGVLFIIFLLPGMLTVFIWPEFSWANVTPFFFQNADPDADWLKMADLYVPLTNFEICLFLFPYVTKESHLFRSFYLGNAFTTSVYVYTVILCLGFYSFEQIKHVLYPNLHLFSFIEFPFFVRIENLVNSVFLVSVLVTVVFYYWMSRLALQQVMKKKRTRFLTLLLIVFSIILTMPFKTQQELELGIVASGRYNSVLSFVLPLFLLMLLFLKKKRK